MKRRNFTAELTEVNRLIAENPNEAENYYKRAYLYYEYDLHLDLDPDEIFEDAYEYDPGDYDFDEMIVDDLDKVFELNPNHTGAYCLLGVLRLSECENEQAMEAFEKAASIDSQCKEGYWGKALVLHDDEEYEEAVAYFSKAIELDKNYTDAYRKRARSYSLMEDKETEELADLNKVLELDPTDFKTYNERGVFFLYTEENYKAALLDFEKSIELDVTNYHGIWNYLHSADAYHRMDNYATALKWYDKAIEIANDGAGQVGAVYAARAAFFDERGEYEAAIADYSRAAELEPEKIMHIYSRAFAYERAGNYENALSDYRRVLEMEDKDSHIFDKKATAREAIENIEKRR